MQCWQLMEFAKDGNSPLANFGNCQNWQFRKLPILAIFGLTESYQKWHQNIPHLGKI